MEIESDKEIPEKINSINSQRAKLTFNRLDGLEMSNLDNCQSDTSENFCLEEEIMKTRHSWKK